MDYVIPIPYSYLSIAYGDTTRAFFMDAEFCELPKLLKSNT